MFIRLIHIIFLLVPIISLSQVYMDTSAMTVIHNNRTAYEGDMYLDTINNIYKIGLTNGELGYVIDNQNIDSLRLINDTLLATYITRGQADTLSLVGLLNNAWRIDGNNNINDNTHFLGTINNEDLVVKTNNTERLRVDSIGDVKLSQYLDSRADDTTTYLNVLYTDNSGNLRSARREIVPPMAHLSVFPLTTGNSFNYYNHYATQMTNAGLQAIASSDLDFYVLGYDTSILSNVSISATGVLSYDVITTVSTKTFVDVRFFTK